MGVKEIVHQESDVPGGLCHPSVPLGYVFKHIDQAPAIRCCVEVIHEARCRLERLRSIPRYGADLIYCLHRGNPCHRVYIRRLSHGRVECEELVVLIQLNGNQGAIHGDLIIGLAKLDGCCPLLPSINRCRSYMAPRSDVSDHPRSTPLPPGGVPRVLVTDHKNYGAAKRGVWLSLDHRQHRSPKNPAGKLPPAHASMGTVDVRVQIPPGTHVSCRR